MGNFRDNEPRGGGRDRRRTEMHHAVCDQCGKNCKVPFKPSGDKPIYCSDCFDKKGGGRDDRSGERGSNRPRPHHVSPSDPNISRLVEKIDTLNSKLNQIIDLASSSINKEKQKKVAPVTEKIQGLSL